MGRTGWMASGVLALCLAGAAAQAKEPRITTGGAALPAERWESPSQRVVPPSSTITIRQQRGVTIIAPVRQPPPPRSLVPAEDTGNEETVVYADGSTAPRQPVAAPRGETAPIGFALRRAGRTEVVDLPGYGPRLVIYR